MGPEDKHQMCTHCKAIPVTRVTIFGLKARDSRANRWQTPPSPLRVVYRFHPMQEGRAGIASDMANLAIGRESAPTRRCRRKTETDCIKILSSVSKSRSSAAPTLIRDKNHLRAQQQTRTMPHWLTANNVSSLLIWLKGHHHNGVASPQASRISMNGIWGMKQYSSKRSTYVSSVTG